MLKFETDSELLNLVKALDYRDLVSEYDLDELGNSTSHPVLGNVEVVASTHSNEYEYDGYSNIDAFRVLHLKDIDKFIKLVGTYSSYGGFEVDEVFIVNPTEKTIIVYE